MAAFLRASEERRHALSTARRSHAPLSPALTLPASGSSAVLPSLFVRGLSGIEFDRTASRRRRRPASSFADSGFSVFSEAIVRIRS